MTETAVVALCNLTDDETIKEGEQAYRRVKHGQCWQDWVKTGKAIKILRAQANGDDAYKTLLEQHGFGDMDKTVRSRLLKCIDLPEIETWLASVPTTKRLTLNHPGAVLRAFERATKPSKPRQSSGQRDVDASKVEAELLEENVRLQERLHAVCEQLDRVRRTGGGFFDGKMSKEQIADAIEQELEEKAADKATEVIVELMQRREAFTKRIAERQTAAEHTAAAESQTPSAASAEAPSAAAAEPSEEARAEPPPASAPPQEPPTAPNAMTPASPQEPSWKPKPGRPKIGARKLVGAYRHLKKGPIHCDPDDARAEGWAILEYCRREDGVKPEWLVVAECVSREQAQEALAASAAKAAEGGFVAGAGP